MARRSLSISVRFAVMNRDRFTCQYCGKHPPDVRIEVDHRTPVSRGGSDDLSNLVTACFECNRGKAAQQLIHDSSPTPAPLSHSDWKAEAERVCWLLRDAHAIALHEDCFGERARLEDAALQQDLDITAEYFEHLMEDDQEEEFIEDEESYEEQEYPEQSLYPEPTEREKVYDEELGYSW